MDDAPVALPAAARAGSGEREAPLAASAAAALTGGEGLCGGVASLDAAALFALLLGVPGLRPSTDACDPLQEARAGGIPAEDASALEAWRYTVQPNNAPGYNHLDEWDILRYLQREGGRSEWHLNDAKRILRIFDEPAKFDAAGGAPGGKYCACRRGPGWRGGGRATSPT
jgi:hypothetical protein